MAVPIFLFAAVVSIVVGFASDYSNRRYLFCAGLLLPVIVALGILLASNRLSVGARYAACFLLTSGSVAAMSISITWLSNNIDSRKVRGIALGFVAAMGNCGSIIGSNVYLRHESPYYPTGFGVCLALTILAFVAATMQLIYLNKYRSTTKANVVI